MENETEQELIADIQKMDDDTVTETAAGLVYLLGDTTKREAIYKEYGKEDVDWTYNVFITEAHKRGITDADIKARLSDAIKTDAMMRLEEIINKKRKKGMDTLKIVSGLILAFVGFFGANYYYKSNKKPASIGFGIVGAIGLLLIYFGIKK